MEHFHQEDEDDEDVFTRPEEEEDDEDVFTRGPQLQVLKNLETLTLP